MKRPEIKKYISWGVTAFCVLAAAILIYFLCLRWDHVMGVIGGFMTPAGGPTNIVAINALEDIGIRVTFLDWMIVGYPIGIICAVLFALWICLFYKPEKIDERALTVAHEMVSGSGAGNSTIYSAMTGSSAPHAEDVKEPRAWMNKVIRGAALTKYGR